MKTMNARILVNVSSVKVSAKLHSVFKQMQKAVRTQD